MISALSRALQDDDVPVYFDTSVLLRCYELSAKARAELFLTFEVLADKVRIPLWTAKEIFARTRASSRGNPFAKPRLEILTKLSAFKDLAHRYVDDDGAPTDKADEFFEHLAGIEAEFRRATAGLTSHRIDAEHTTALLVPLVNERVLSSDLDAIVARAGREGELRFSHG